MRLDRLRTDVEPEGVLTFRTRRGWTHEQMADEVHATPLEVAAWEAGTVRVPREQARRIRALVQEDHETAAVVAASLGPCRWVERKASDLHLRMASWRRVAMSDAEAQHVRDCETCSRVRDVRRDLYVFPDDPGLGFDDPLRRLTRFLDALPRALLLPLLAFGGFGVLLAVALVLRPVFSLLPEFPDLPELPAGAGLAAMAGAILYSLPDRWLPRRVRRDAFATGLVRAILGTATALEVLALNGLDPSSPALLAGFALFALVLGVVTGAYTRWMGDDGEEDPLPEAATGVEEAPGPRLLDAAAMPGVDEPGPRAERVHVYSAGDARAR